jgi:serine/threonine-protein kinase
VPPHVEAAVLTALSKLPADRFPSALAFTRALDTVPSGAITSRPAAPLSRRANLAAIGLAIALVAIGWMLGRFTRAAPQPVSPLRHFSIAMPDFVANTDRGFALSPDGTTLAYTRSTAGGQELRVSRIDEGELRTVPGSDFARAPLFSPDGHSIAFQSLADGLFYRVAADGRSRPERFSAARIVEPTYGVWAAADTILAVSEFALYRVVAGARSVDTLLRLADSTQYGPVEIGAIGSFALISTLRPTPQTLAFDLRTRRLSQFVSGYYRPTPLSNGVMLLTDLAGDLFAAHFDAANARLVDRPLAVLRGPQTLLGNRHFAVTSAGMLIYFKADEPAHLAFADMAGRVTRGSTDLAAPRYSPDGKRVAGMKRASNSPGGAIWVYDLTRDVASHVSAGVGSSSSEERDSYPTWTPDGRRLLFARMNTKTTAQDVYWQDVTGGPAEVFLGGPDQERDLELSHDGTMGVFRVRRDKGGDIWLLDRHTRPMTTRALLDSPADEGMPTLSRDGKWLAYVSDETGRREVYVCDFPGARRRWQISRDGGGEPVWAPSGTELYYRRGDAVMAVSITARTEIVAGPPRLLFRGTFVSNTLARAYDVSPDGTHFVFEQAAETERAEVVLNWFASWPKSIRP